MSSRSVARSPIISTPNAYGIWKSVELTSCPSTGDRAERPSFRFATIDVGYS
jgi:hypothetical protein